MKNNIRTLINALEICHQKPGKQVAFVFLDAEKAFDKVKWRYIIQQLLYMECGETFARLVKEIYSRQYTRIVINADRTNLLKITNGTRQGCPLSPLLFILTLQPLLIQLRNNTDIKGLKIRNQEFKIQAFVDDILLILENPINSIQVTVDILEEYIEWAGMKKNKNKTQILCKNLSQSQKEELEEKSKIKVTNRIKYLGITISASALTLIKYNYEKCASEIRKKMEEWAEKDLSLFGKIASVKMMMLPKLLFLFQNLPILTS